jgi:cobyrinic acid a,c-diamide synthase
MKFDPDVNIKGVILNRVAGPRHEKILRNSIEHHCDVPVLGAIPKLDWQNFPERHMGLLPTPEHEWAKDSIDAASQIANRYLDLEALVAVADDAGALPISAELRESIQRPRSGISALLQQASIGPAEAESTLHSDQHIRPRIGIIKDSAFQFYYPENLKELEAEGAETIFISPLVNDNIPPVDALYIGGGFPETHARQLAENVTFRQQLKALAQEGLPIYAECGGLMYLGEELVLDEKSFPMAGVLPVVFGFSKKPQGHGYTIVTVEKPNPYYKVGTQLKGHEFHYSHVLDWRGDDKDLVFAMKRGAGFVNRRDGVCYKNVLATYTHIHALGTPSWAISMVRKAASYKNQKK